MMSQTSGGGEAHRLKLTYFFCGPKKPACRRRILASQRMRTNAMLILDVQLEYLIMWYLMCYSLSEF